MDAHRTLADAVVRIEGVADDVQIVVRQRTGAAPRYFLFRAGFLRSIAQQRPTALAEDGLNLKSARSARTVAAEDAASIVDDTVVVLNGDAVAGVLVGTNGDRGAGTPTQPAPTWPAPGPFDHGFSPSTVDNIFVHPPEETPADMGDVPHGGAEGMPNDGDTGEGWPGGGRGLPANRETPAAALPPFTASTAIDCPSAAVVGEQFDVVVGLEPPPSTGEPTVGVTVHTGLAEFDLVVSIAAAGFQTKRTRDVLHVVRSDPGAERVTFTLTPEPIDGEAVSALLRIDFSFGGVPCGTAWLAIVVTAGRTGALASAPRKPSESPIIPAPLPITVGNHERPPDLVITISENEDSTQLEWQFACKDADIEVPSTAVSTRFQQHNARSFALQQVRLIHESIGDAAIDARVTGVSRTIANQIPTEAWQVLSAVWQRASAQSRLPGVLIVTTDAYIPWELASTEDTYLDATLTDSGIAQILGAQVPISRWNVPNARGVRGVLAPPQPPPESLGVGGMALVIGDYLVESAQRPLPMATEEGNELAALYTATQLTATLSDIDPLFDGELERDGVRIEPDLVHFACHGQADANPRFNGIILNDGNLRLDPLYVAGRRRREDFIFLNACQIGQSTQLLEEAGGFATQFLNTGAGGFIAPLWNVDDQIAKETALGFYAATLGSKRITVAEALRRRRAMYDPGAAVPQPTHLAYVYYGHPNLILNPRPPLVREGAPA
ncbi:CHAT domain-containing protein [Agromyces bracchium]|uniref:CHAT domain-containing protein n=1 Tax=Agromyces bracchium TaxID=88376 RepID=UPI0018AC958A|nr:CHAT domain-containing protein [Agromyces bracchium]